METEGSPSYVRQPTNSLLTKPDKTITPYFDMMYIFNCNWVDTRRQYYSTHLHTNSTQNAESGTYITIKKLTNLGSAGFTAVFPSYTLAFALQLRKKH
jgi:hypothetical protein